MILRKLKIAAVLSLVLLASCSGLRKMSEGSDENMRFWFNMATDIKLPKRARLIYGKNCFLVCADIYMKIIVPLDFITVLDKHMKRCNADFTVMKLPEDVDKDDWGKKLKAAWDIENNNPEQVVWFKFTNKVKLKSNDESDELYEDDGFYTTIMFDKKTGVMYCRIVERFSWN